MMADRDGVKWAAEPMCMHYPFPINSKPLFSAKAIKLRKIPNISTAIAQGKAAFLDIMLSPLSYAQVLEELFGCTCLHLAHNRLPRSYNVHKFLGGQL